MSAIPKQMAALNDETRRKVFEVVCSGARSVAEIARHLPVSRPAVSQHLRVLTDAGLVTHRVEGTRHVYHLDLNGITVLRGYLDSLWQTALGQYKAEAERTWPQRKEDS